MARNRQSEIFNLMRLYVEPMDAVVVAVSQDGRVRLEGEEWSMPTLQERRAIIFAAQQELAALTELLEIVLDTKDTKGTKDTKDSK